MLLYSIPAALATKNIMIQVFCQPKSRSSGGGGPIFFTTTVAVVVENPAGNRLDACQKKKFHRF